MSYPLRLQAQNGVSIHSNSKHEFMHSDNSLLQDLITLKPSLMADHMLKFDGSNLTYQPSSDFVASADLSSLDGRVTAIEGAGYALATDVGISIDGLDIRLSTVESSYATTQNVQDVAGDLNTLGTRVSDVESNKASTADLGDLVTRVSAIESDFATNTDVGNLQTTTQDHETRLVSLETDQVTQADLDGFAPLSGASLVSPSMNTISLRDDSGRTSAGSAYSVHYVDFLNYEVNAETILYSLPVGSVDKFFIDVEATVLNYGLYKVCAFRKRCLVSRYTGNYQTTDLILDGSSSAEILASSDGNIDYSSWVAFSSDGANEFRIVTPASGNLYIPISCVIKVHKINT